MVNPSGCTSREEILFADLDPGAIAESRFDLDVTGHYARSDVLALVVNEKPLASVSFVDGGDACDQGLAEK